VNTNDIHEVVAYEVISFRRSFKRCSLRGYRVLPERRALARSSFSEVVVYEVIGFFLKEEHSQGLPFQKL
jgi:hypothetical protein